MELRAQWTVIFDVYALEDYKHHRADICKGDGVASSQPNILVASVVRGPSKNSEHGVLGVSGKERTQKASISIFSNCSPELS